MKKVVFSLFIMLVTSLLYANGSLETDKYKVQMDESCTDPELLMSPEGDMYFFYVKNSKLIIEKKGKDESEFSYMENTFFDPNKTVKSIKRFRMSDDTYSLLALTSVGTNDSLYHLAFNNNDLLLTNNSRIDNELPGVITDYKQEAIGHDKSIITYIKSNILNYIYLKRGVIHSKSILNKNVSEYKLIGVLEGDRYVLKGYIVDENNSLYYLKINKENYDVKLLNNFSVNPTVNIYNSLGLKNNKFILFADSNMKIFEYNIDSDEVIPNIYDYPSSDSTHYFINNGKLSHHFLRFYNHTIEFDNGLSITDVNKYYIYLNRLYYLDLNGSYFSVNLTDSFASTLVDNNILDFYCYDYEHLRSLAILKADGDNNYVDIYVNGLDGLVKYKTLDFTESININSDINKYIHNIKYEVLTDIIQDYRCKTFQYDSEYKFISTSQNILLTRENFKSSIEVIK